MDDLKPPRRSLGKKPSKALAELRVQFEQLSRAVLDLKIAAEDARDLARTVAADRVKFGPISTKAQQLVGQLNAAVEPFKNDRHSNS